MRLKPKEKEFVKALVHKNNENGTETVKEVFGIENDNYARLKAHRLITKDNISQAIEVEKETLKSALEKKGITPEKIADKINVLLDAEDIETGKKDYTAIDKGLKHAKEIYGVESGEDKPKTQTTYNFIFNAETQREIKDIEEKIKARLINNENIPAN